MPFRVDYSNFLAVAAQYVIMLTFMGALLVETNSVAAFNLTDFWLGVILSAINIFVIFMAGYIGWDRYKKEQEQIKVTFLLFISSLFICVHPI